MPDNTEQVKYNAEMFAIVASTHMTPQAYHPHVISLIRLLKEFPQYDWPAARAHFLNNYCLDPHPVTWDAMKKAQAVADRLNGVSNAS